MSKKVTKRSIDGVNKTRSCACKLKYLLLYKIFWNFFFFFFLLFQKKWVGRAMGNETFYGDGLTRRTAPSRAVPLFNRKLDLVVAVVETN